MITLLTDVQDLEQMFNRLSTQTNGNLKHKDQDYTLLFNNNFGNGIIKGIQLPNKITYIEYDVRFNQDILLGRKMIKPNLVYFIYSSRGDVGYDIDSSTKKKELKEFRTCIFSSETSTKSKLCFRKGVHYKVSMIVLRKSTRQYSPLVNNRIVGYFNDKIENHSFMYIGSINLQIAQKIEEIDELTQNSLVRPLLTQSLVQTIMALQIQQYFDDIESVEQQMGTLTIREIKKAKELSSSIINNPEQENNISSLCYTSGLSPAKLQLAFKLLHQQTVNDFIRNERLKMAEKLIRERELTISEIVYSVGLTSRSYFSKIFKAKYHCSPKFYQNNYLTFSESA